jgi:long-chain fatty acid transport protein
MVHLRGSQFEGGAAVVFPSIKFEGAATVLGTPIPGGNGGNAGRIEAIPHFYGVMPLTSDLSIGLAITSPFGSTAKYDPDWAGRYLEFRAVARSADINPSIAYRVNDMFSVGAGVSAQFFKLDAAAAFPQFLIPGIGGADGYYNFKADDWSWGWNVGALMDLGATRIGATYRSQVDHDIKGSLDFTGMNPALGTVSGRAHADVSLPGSATVSVTQIVDPRLSFSGEVQWTGWSAFDQILVMSGNPPFNNVQGYEDSWMVSIGAVYRLNDLFILRGGAGWDQSPVRDRFRTVAVPDVDRYMVGLGFGYRLNEALSVDGAYTHYFAAEKGTMNISSANTDPFTGFVVLNGEYTNQLDYLALTFRYGY